MNSGRSNPESVARHKQPVKAVVTRDSISKNSESSLVRSLTVRSNNARVHHEVALKKPVKRRAFCCSSGLISLPKKPLTSGLPNVPFFTCPGVHPEITDYQTASHGQKN